MNIAVVGSLNLDRTFRVPHLPAPGETVLARTATTGLGGKGANQAVAAARAGAATRFIGCVGEDGTGAVEALRAEGIDVSGVTVVDGRPTGSASITVDDDAENTIVVDPGANDLLDPAHVARQLAVSAPTHVLVQLEIPHACVRAAVEHEAFTVLNAAPADAPVGDLVAGVDLLVVNAREHDALGAAAGKAPRRVITHGADGVTVVDGTSTAHIPAVAVEAVDTTGAGDTFCGYLTARLSDGADLHHAATVAAGAAAVACTRPGASASSPRPGEIGA